MATLLSQPKYTMLICVSSWICPGYCLLIAGWSVRRLTKVFIDSPFPLIGFLSEEGLLIHVRPLPEGRLMDELGERSDRSKPSTKEPENLQLKPHSPCLSWMLIQIAEDFMTSGSVFLTLGGHRERSRLALAVAARLPAITPIKHDQSRQQCPKLLAKCKVLPWTKWSTSFSHPDSPLDGRINLEHTSWSHLIIIQRSDTEGVARPRFRSQGWCISGQMPWTVRSWRSELVSEWTESTKMLVFWPSEHWYCD